jgi:transketolase
MIVARTVKGKGISFIEGREGWHGKVLQKGDELDRALADIRLTATPPAAPSATVPQETA